MDDTQTLPAFPAPSPPSVSLPDSDDRPSSSSSETAPLPSSSLGSDPPHAYDLGRHPKSKRKRTAAKDKAILEAAYTTNPKPDKAARLAIVNRVSLNEKEVQIWFQNRRQNDRRKSRPLSPQEIAALRYGGMQILSSDPPSHNPFNSDITQTSPPQSMARLDPGVVSPPRSDPPSSGSCDEVEKTPEVLQKPRRWDEAEAVEGNEIVTPAPKGMHGRGGAEEASRYLPSSVSYTSSRPWAANSSFTTPSTFKRRGDDSFRLENFESSAYAENREDLLTVQAKHESSGSAIAAISLIRSTSSSGSPLQPSNSSKRNAAASRAAPRGGMAKKPKLSRASSSAAKLQSTLGLSESVLAEREPETGAEKTKIIPNSGHDSDKENWSPDAEGNPRFTFSQPYPAAPNGRRPLPSAPSKLDRNPRRTPGRFLPENQSPGSLLGRSNTAPVYSQARRTGKRGQSPLEIYEDTENHSPSASVPSDEVERLIGVNVSPSKKGDIDAVAGLLSLSQGNWR
ncbi:hypothetical protein OQA88_4075 [Cercophora sp. LCS_1]